MLVLETTVTAGLKTFFYSFWFMIVTKAAQLRSGTTQSKDLPAAEQDSIGTKKP